MRTKLHSHSFFLTHLIFGFLFCSGLVYSQVGIGTMNPAEGSILDIESTDAGILIPRLALVSTVLQTPVLTSGALTTGMLVYNTATAGSGNTAVTPGFYYWDASEWVRIMDASVSGSNENIYTTDGTLTQNRTVSQTTHGLTFEGNIGRHALTIRRTNNATETGLAFRNSGNAYDAAIYMESPNSQGLVIASGGNENDPIDLIPSAIFNNSGSSSFSAEIGVYENIANQGDLIGRLYAANNDGILEINRNGASNHILSGNSTTIFNNQQVDLDMRFATNDEANTLFIDGTNNNLGIGTNTTFIDTGLTINNSAYDFGMTAVLGNSSTGNAVEGITTGSGNGVFGSTTTNHGVFGLSSATSTSSIFTGVLGFNSGLEGATGIVGVTSQQASFATNIGIRAIAGSTVSITPVNYNNVGLATNASELAFSAITENPIQSNGDADAAVFQTNFAGSSIDADSRDPRVRLAGFENNAITPLGNGGAYYGAFLYSGGSTNNSSYAYAGARFNNTNYKILGNGTVSTIVDDPQDVNKKRIMFATEAPEVLFEDYGEGQLSNGKTSIQIDPVFSENIIVDAKHPLRVFIQLEGDCKGVYITNKSKTGFTVIELQKGKSNVSFSWHIVANRKDDNTSKDLSTNSTYSDLRFPIAPQPKEAIASKSSRITTYQPAIRN